MRAERVARSTLVIALLAVAAAVAAQETTGPPGSSQPASASTASRDAQGRPIPAGVSAPLEGSGGAPKPTRAAPGARTGGKKLALGEASFEEELKRASALLQSGDARAALRAFSTLERSRPDGCVDCLLGIAAANNGLGLHSAAEKAARQALPATAAPAAQVMGWSLLGVSFYDRTPLDGSAGELARNMSEAEAAFRRALEIDGGRTEMVRWNLASALEWLGRQEEANVLWSDPERASPVVGSADAGGSAGSADEAPPVFVSGDVQKPVKLGGAQPQYSERARRQRIQGLVILQTVIDTRGRITAVKVLQGLRGCTMAAIRALRTWTFRPATIAGEPVAVYFNLTVNFELR